ncbi:2-dehydropantoate 2-reductase [Paenibacillus sp. PvR098]|uniref:2-dehydropantoate 2-reductase n=1 Tax=unclassified Paenibacillus TaxID=185978 RepID=UPI001B63B1B5|nr:2-dehydropantoate 2-reductase [Paenibacillus sp. PvP091]MBP1168322.1 2-dehydropantoate 2-reductase [Paenibacillus sp. PvR098]MBP2439350.1 2-dehydropantoate 2-reductase [Paenibacillus sp. PvP052]
MNRITVIGAGALGMLFTVKLAEAVPDMELVVRRPSQKQLLMSAGVSLTEAGSWLDRKEKAARTSTVYPKVVLMNEERLIQDDSLAERENTTHWIVLAVKQSAFTKDLAEAVRRRMGPHSWVVCLQNGIGHVEAISSIIPEERIVLAVTTEGALRRSETEAAHTGRGVTWIGGAGSTDDEVAAAAQKKWVELLEVAGFQAFLSKNITSRVWHKLLINAVINPLTAILQVTNGELPGLPQAQQLMRALFDEGTALAAALRIELDPDLWEQLLEVCRRTSANRSSMLQDVLAGRPTEIDAINGGLLKKAESVGLFMPAHQAVYQLMKALEGRLSLVRH